MNLILGLLTLIVTALPPSTAAANPAYQSAGRWRSYPTPDRVTALAARGDMVWAGTPAGLIRFNQIDGTSVTYTMADGLTSNDISAVAIDPDGRPWVGAWDGNISRFDGQAWQAIRLLEAPEDGVYVSAIAFDDLGQAWYGLYGYGVHGQGQDFTSANGLSESYVMAMAIRGQEVWVGTRLSLSRYDGQNWHNFTPKDGLTGPGVTAVAIDPLGQVWAGTYESGLNRFDGQNWTGFTTADGLPDNAIKAIAINAAGQPWVATSKGVAHFDGRQWTTYTTAAGLADDNVKAITVDDDGHIWFGTAAGLTEFIPPIKLDFSTYTVADGLPGDKIRDIAFDTGGRAWVGTYEGGAALFDGQSWTTYTAGKGFFDPQKNRFVPTDDGLADANVQAILPLFDDRVWFGTGGGVSFLDGQLWRHYTYADDGLAANTIESLTLGRGGHIWATHLAAGVSRFDGQSWTTFTVDDGLADNWVHAAAVDSDGRLWFGTNAGVSQYDGQNWTTYTTADGLADNTVFAVTVTPNRQQWFGTAGGLSQFDGQSWTTHLVGRAIQDVTVASNGDIWAVGSGRVSRLVLPETPESGQATWVDYLSDHFAGQDLRAVAVDPVGRVWVGSFGAGLTIFYPDQSPTSRRVWFSAFNDAHQFTRLAATPDGPVWAVDSTHLAQVSGPTPRLFDLPAELREQIAANSSPAFPTVTDLVAAADGTVWLSTKTDLYRFAGGNWRHFTPAEGLPAETVLRLTVDAQNHLWVIFGENEGYLLARFDGQQWQSWPLPDIAVAPTGLAALSGGEMWLAVFGRTPFRFDGSEWTQPVEGWTAGSFDMFLAAGSAGGVWFGSDKGWQRWAGHNWQGLEVTIPAPFSYPAAVDANGGAWGIVTGACYWCRQVISPNEYGAVYVTPEQSCRFTAATGGFGGPPLDPPLVRPDAIRDIALGADGRVWFIAQGQIIAFSPQKAVCDYAAPENVRVAE